MSSSPRREMLIGAVFVAAGIGTGFSPDDFQSRLRNTVRDAGRPGQFAVRWLADRTSNAVRDSAKRIAGSSAGTDASGDDLPPELEFLRSRVRQLQVENARLNEVLADLRYAGTQRYQGDAGAPLIVPDLLDTAILGRENADLVRSGALLDAGSTAGIAESSLVLDDPRPLLDQGVDAQISAGQSVFAGRCIVGRIAAVGRRVSTLQPLTDPKFRGLAQIVRRTEAGAVFGAEGLLEGHGEELCRLTLVPATEAVVEGDEVYTSGRDANTPEPMHYGTIVRAELPDGASHWDISVKPAARLASLRSVQVLRRKLNPARVLAQ